MLQRIVFLSVILLLVPAIQADTTLIYDDGGRQSLLRIAGDRVRFDNSRDGRWFLFDAARREITLVDPARREYTIIDEAGLVKLQDTMDTVVSRLQAGLAEMPPAMREQLQQMAGGALRDPPGEPAVRLEATGRRGEAGG